MNISRMARALMRRAIGPERVDNFRMDRDFARELRSDLLAREHAKKLLRFKDLYPGRRCVIVGNGPSLASMDLSILRNEITFGLNRIYLLFDKIGFSTTFLVSVNDHVARQCVSEMQGTLCKKFFSIRSRSLVDHERDDIVLLRHSPRPRFCIDPPSQGVWEGANVTNVAIQLAHFMGFTTVVLIGVDHRFSTGGAPHTLVVADGPDSDHFDPRYFGKGWAWQLPDLEVSEQSYRTARQTFANDGRVIVDATVGGALTVFPKVDLHTFLGSHGHDGPQQ